jgi:hypothetical protein
MIPATKSLAKGCAGAIREGEGGGEKIFGLEGMSGEEEIKE